VQWAVRGPGERLLDPACGDGRFLVRHRNSVGVEQDQEAARAAMARAPWALVHEGDFFAWARATEERFDCAAGNPPFIRYQSFRGEVREQALSLCAARGVRFSGLAGSWAPFLVAVAGLLKPGGRMAFVVPAEIGHAPYAAPVFSYLIEHFDLVQVVAVRGKLFPELSEDCWLLYAAGCGGSTCEIRLSVVDHLTEAPEPPKHWLRVPSAEWDGAWRRRLRPYLMNEEARALYRHAAGHAASCSFGDIAQIGIGYVSGDNDFFHLTPSAAEKWNIPPYLLQPTVRNGRVLRQRSLTPQMVEFWRRADQPMLLLNLPKRGKLPRSVESYLDTEPGRAASERYKCRMRNPWYSVPDVTVPAMFLTYMSGTAPSLVRNLARCACTNSVHSVRVRDPQAAQRLFAAWDHPFLQLSCELEGHPLGGGVLKLEPREAARIVLPPPTLLAELDTPAIAAAVGEMRAWRHCGG
jgi:adenine-specific DNA-methyltransferase